MKTAKVGGVMGKIGALLTVLFAVAIIAAPKSRADDDKTIRVGVGEAVSFPAENVAKLAIADPTIADVTPLSEKELSVIGKKAGVTTLSVVREGSPSQSYRVEVGNDAAASTIREMIGQPGITVRSIGDTIILDGQVDDEVQAGRANLVASAYKDKVLNLLEVRNPRQIRIRVRVAEVNSDALKKIGVQYLGPNGQVTYAWGRVIQEEPSIANNRGSIHGFVTPDITTFSVGTVPAAVQATLRLLITKGYARLLSEPTLVTLSGKEASFLVGEQRPIVQQLQNTFTVEFKEVGVRMKIKPTADSQNRINTTVHAEVSQVTGTVGDQAIPVISTKQQDTTLQVNDGQTVIMGGLLENNISKDVLRKVPWLAEIPIFGFLFRDKEFEQSHREVIFMMTMEIVKDVDTDVATAIKTPMLKDWNAHAMDNVLPMPSKRDNWGMHRPDGLGFAGEGLRDYEQPILGNEPDSRRPKAEPKTKAPKPSASEENAVSTPVVSEAVETPAPVVAAPAPEPQPAPAPVRAPAPAAKAPVVKAAPSEPAKDPTTNFAPARPVVQ